MIELALLAVALWPVVIWLNFFWEWGDYHPGTGTVSKSVLFGAMTILPLFALVGLVNGGFEGLGRPPTTWPEVAFGAFVKAAIPEELLKWLCLLWIFRQQRDFMLTAFELIMLAVAVSIGFAAIENILYVIQHDHGTTVAVVRAVSAIPMHAFAGVVMGFFALMAVKHGSRFYWGLALVLPIMMHGIYNLAALGLAVGGLSGMFWMVLLALAAILFAEAYIAIRLADRAHGIQVIFSDRPIPIMANRHWERFRKAHGFRKWLWRLAAVPYFIIGLGMALLSISALILADEMREVGLERPQAMGVQIIDIHALCWVVALVAFFHGISCWAMSRRLKRRAKAVSRQPKTESEWDERAARLRPSSELIDPDAKGKAESAGSDDGYNRTLHFGKRNQPMT